MFELMAPFIQELQDLEVALNDLRELRDINNATGEQLDGLGDILDCPRAGMTDDETYRVALQLKKVLNISSGQPEALISYVKWYIGVGESCEYREPWPAYFTFHVMAAADLKTLRGALDALKPAGVGFEIIYMPTGTERFNTADENGFASPGDGFLEDGYAESEGYTAGALSELA
jgi:hypothetical protein